MGDINETLAGNIFDEILSHLSEKLDLYFTPNVWEFGNRLETDKIVTVPFSVVITLLYNDIREGLLPNAGKIIDSKNVLSKIVKSIHKDLMIYFKDHEGLKQHKKPDKVLETQDLFEDLYAKRGTITLRNVNNLGSIEKYYNNML